MLLSWVLSVTFLVMGLYRLVLLSSVKAPVKVKYGQEYRSRVAAVNFFLTLSAIMAYIALTYT